MEIALDIREKVSDAWLPSIYREKIRPLRTRAYSLQIAEIENSVAIQHTLLGIELKVGKVRLSCPDVSTARYLQVFARLGCQEIAVPYDITQIPLLADELEASWQSIVLCFAELTVGKPKSRIVRIRSALIKQIRVEINEIGAGEKMPQFKQTTSQRAA